MARTVLGEMRSGGHWTEPLVKDKWEVLVAGEQDVKNRFKKGSNEL